jgi:hypothetical protein
MNNIVRLYFVACVAFLSMLITSYSHAQVVNGNFENGTVSWSWTDGCSGASQLITPSLNTDTPFQFTNFGRSAKMHQTGTTPNPGSACRKISQQIFVPIGSNLSFDLWTNNGQNSQTAKRFSGSLSIILRDTASGLVRSYTICNAPTTNLPLCTSGATLTNNGLIIESAFWGKTVELTIGTVVNNDAFSSPARFYVDNVQLIKPAIVSVLPKTGAWYNPARSGHGLHLSKASDGRYQIMWYTYLSNGQPVWYISELASVINGVLNAKIRKSVWNYTTQSNTLTNVGDIKFEINGTNQFTFLWDLYSVNGDNAGFDGGEPMSFLIGGDSYTGLWYEPAYSGYGYSLDYRNSSPYTAATVFYYVNGEPVWARSDKTLTPTAGTVFPMTAFKGLGLCPECNGQTITRTSTAVGEVGFSLDLNKSWVLLQDATTGATVWQRGVPTQPVDTSRLTFP